MRCAGMAIDTRRRQQQEGFEAQLRQAACHNADMCLRRIDRAAAEMSVQTDAVDDVAARLARRKQCGDRGSRDGMNPVIPAFQPGDERRADEATGAEDHERCTASRHGMGTEAFCLRHPYAWVVNLSLPTAPAAPAMPMGLRQLHDGPAQAHVGPGSGLSGATRAAAKTAVSVVHLAGCRGARGGHRARPVLQWRRDRRLRGDPVQPVPAISRWQQGQAGHRRRQCDPRHTDRAHAGRQNRLHHHPGAARPGHPARAAQCGVQRRRNRGRCVQHTAVVDPAAGAVRRHLDVRIAGDDGRARRRLRRRPAVGGPLEGQAGGRDRREGHLQRRGRRGRSQGGTARDHRLPEAAGRVHQARRAYPARHPAGRAARDR